MKKLFGELMRLAGKVLFVMGVVFGVVVLLLGGFPGLFIWLLVLVGFGVAASDHLKWPRVFRLPEHTTETARNQLKAIHQWLGGEAMGKSAAQGLVLGLLLLVVLPLAVFFLGQGYFKKRDAQRECAAITAALRQYQQSERMYPPSLSEFIGNDPLRRSWEKDSWNNPYQYTRTTDGRSFTLLSAGPDGKPNTSDDLLVKSN